MNTPAHLAASLLLWRKEAGWGAASAIACGAILPDAPMFGFYLYQKIIGSSEREIWSTHYFAENWQAFFDAFNSIPIFIVLMAVFYFASRYRTGFRWGMLLAASALLHVACDLPLHNDDAHRHFWPLTDWRYRSPVSYWDPKFYGIQFMLREILFAVLASGLVAWQCKWQSKQRPMRILAILTLALYAVGIAFAVVVWMPS